MKTSLFLCAPSLKAWGQRFHRHRHQCWEASTFGHGDHTGTRTRGLRNDRLPIRLLSTEFDHGEQLDSDGRIAPSRTYVLRFDGGSRGNPGIAGAGMVLYDSVSQAEVWCGMEFLGDGFTNNQAEFSGLVTGVKCARALGVKHIVVQGDSQLVLRQISGEYKVKSPSLKGYFAEAMKIIHEFDTFQTNHILRGRNSRADELANLAMDRRSSAGFIVSDAPS